jgi:hypothetical protein
VGLGQVVEGVGSGGVDVQPGDEVTLFEEHPERHHAQYARFRDGAGSELRPPLISAQIVAMEHRVLQHRVNARPAHQLVLDLVDLHRQLTGRGHGLEVTPTALGHSRRLGTVDGLDGGGRHDREGVVRA